MMQYLSLLLWHFEIIAVCILDFVRGAQAQPPTHPRTHTPFRCIMLDEHRALVFARVRCSRAAASSMQAISELIKHYKCCIFKKSHLPTSTSAMDSFIAHSAIDKMFVLCWWYVFVRFSSDCTAKLQKPKKKKRRNERNARSYFICEDETALIGPFVCILTLFVSKLSNHTYIVICVWEQIHIKSAYCHNDHLGFSWYIAWRSFLGHITKIDF